MRLSAVGIKEVAGCFYVIMYLDVDAETMFGVSFRHYVYTRESQIR